MELELKHLAAYLPYDVKLTHYLGSNVFPLDTSNIHSFVGDNDTKLILRPLSDLTKKEYFKLSGRNPDNDFGFWYGKYNGDNEKRDYIHHEGYSSRKFFLENGFYQFSYGMMEFFFENHFDVFNLIENNLAIDINTLKLKQND